MNSDFLFTSFNTKDAVVWIDPLDGTSEFVKGNLSSVTVLIGVAICGMSKIGIVHTPFLEENPMYGRTLFGTMEHGAFKLYYDENAAKRDMLQRSPEYIDPFDFKTKLDSKHVFKLSSTPSHQYGTIKEVLHHAKPTQIKLHSGAGNKCSYLIMGELEVYFALGLSYWDICGPEVIVKAMGGCATDIFERPLFYDIEARQHQIKGLILTKTPGHHKLLVKRL